jgi:hypothetical protein
MVSIRLHWLRVFHWERNQLLNLFAPITFGEEINRTDAERGSQITHLRQINPQGTALDFGNGAARGVMPAGELQLVSKHILRPTALVAPSADQPPDEIPLLHSSTGSMSHSSAIFLSSVLDEMALWFIFPCDSFLVVRFSHEILPAFLSKFRFPGCNEIITTFGIQKPTSQGMAKPRDGKWGSSN